MSLVPRGQHGSHATPVDYQLRMTHQFFYNNMHYRQSTARTAISKSTILEQLTTHDDFNEYVAAQHVMASFETGWFAQNKDNYTACIHNKPRASRG
jgi:hypothetical protein